MICDDNGDDDNDNDDDDYDDEVRVYIYIYEILLTSSISRGKSEIVKNCLSDKLLFRYTISEFYFLKKKKKICHLPCRWARECRVFELMKPETKQIVINIYFAISFNMLIN